MRRTTTEDDDDATKGWFRIKEAFYVYQEEEGTLSLYMNGLCLSSARIVSRNIFVSLIYWKIFLRTDSNLFFFLCFLGVKPLEFICFWERSLDDERGKIKPGILSSMQEQRVSRHRITDESQSFSLSVSVVLFVSHSLDGCLRNTCFMQRVFS